MLTLMSLLHGEVINDNIPLHLKKAPRLTGSRNAPVLYSNTPLCYKMCHSTPPTLVSNEHFITFVNNSIYTQI